MKGLALEVTITKMKSINFYSIEDHINPEKRKEQNKDQKKPVKFFELSSEGDEPSRTPTVVHSNVKHTDSVNFFEITDAGGGAVDTPEQQLKTEESETESVVVESKPTEEESKEEDPTKEVSSRIVVVEDDNIVSTMLKHLLERRGFSIEIASDGRRASEIVETENPPALVILDVMLPFVDGFELIRKIRSQDKWKDVPIVMLTAKTRETDIVRALEAGADDYVPKPFQPQELIARVKRFVRKS